MADSGWPYVTYPRFSHDFNKTATAQVNYQEDTCGIEVLDFGDYARTTEGFHGVQYGGGEEKAKVFWQWSRGTHPITRHSKKEEGYSPRDT